MNFETAKELLRAHGQEHLLRFWEKLDAKGQAALLERIFDIDFTEVQRMRKMVQERTQGHCHKPCPAPVLKLTRKAHREAFALGEKILAKGQVAVLLVAGGQGSRLGYDGPKGAYPIGPLTDMPLFYFHARKILRLELIHGRPVPFYIMTSEVNDAATRACFEACNYFGLDPANVTFFKQGMWPALDEDGQLMLESEGRIFVSPDGHGGTLTALVKSGCLDDMRTRGIRHIFYFQVDNPLVDIADPAFIGVHVAYKAEMSLKLCLKSSPDEKVGAVSQLPDGRCGIIEYSELTPAQAARFKYGSPAIHLFSLAFLKRVASKPMPLHLAHKRIPYIAADGRCITPEKPNGYKFEKFIFDILPEAKRVVNLAFERDDEFAPVKNAHGEDSPQSCRKALQAKWRRWLGAAGIVVPENIPIEIDPAYANGAAEIYEGLLLG